MKHCSMCKTSKPVSDFRKKQSWCKLCQNAYNRDWYRKNRERGLRWRKNGNLKRTYGITLEEYECISENQNHLCAICSNPEGGKNQYGVKKLAVDHCHKTGRIRGLLCENCNRAIGQMKDDVQILQKAIDYLTRY